MGLVSLTVTVNTCFCRSTHESAEGSLGMVLSEGRDQLTAVPEVVLKVKPEKIPLSFATHGLSKVLSATE